MPRFETTRRVAHAAEAMFDLVADVEAYPEFVPLCERLAVRARRREGEKETFVAEMTVGYKVIRETFTSKVALDRSRLTIRTDYLNGPFRFMENLWTFTPAGDGHSFVGFQIAYEFKSRSLALLMGAMFDRVFRTFADAFEKRADAIYGKADEAQVAEP